MKSNMHFGMSITVPTTEKYWFIWLVFIPKQTKISAQAHCRAKFTRKELIQIPKTLCLRSTCEKDMLERDYLQGKT